MNMGMYALTSDTIAAMATAPGAAGIAVVRVSGPDALEIADKVLRCPGPPPSARDGGRFVRGFVHTAERDIDEVIILIYRAPHSYTREDVVEIQGHGGRTAAARVLRAVTDAGARSAEPGEFTRRAFLNGRIDLIQAEAVADLVSARSDRAASAAMEQLEGSLSDLLQKSYDSIVEMGSDCEASLDFDEDEVPDGLIEEVRRRVGSVTELADRLLETWHEGHLLREGARVVIAGSPNVGKSTLLNALLGRDRAIVTPTPGTTRDTIEEEITIHGIPVRLVDTAGLRDSACDVERAGVARAQASVEQADLVLYLIDATEGQTPDTCGWVGIGPGRAILVVNKIDLAPDPLSGTDPECAHVCCSAERGDGIDELREAIFDRLGVRDTPPHAVISERHRDLLKRAREYLVEAGESLEQGETMLVPAAQAIRGAAEALGTITGQVYTESLLDAIFSRFCVGK